MPEQTDRVILRRYTDKTGTELIAFLPDEMANIGRVLCYVHIGQHSEADLRFYAKGKPEDENTPEAQALIAELRSIGYNPRMVKRLTRPFGGWVK
jgi:hypothetical protein